MRLNIIIIIVCFFFSYSKAQKINDYYQIVNQAEIDISNSEWKNSLDNYKTLYKTLGLSFVKDYHNAILCSIKIDSIDFAVQLALNMLSSERVDISYFQNPNFVAITKNPLWKLNSTQKLNKSRKKLKMEMINRYKLDQDVQDKNRGKTFMLNAQWIKQLASTDTFSNFKNIRIGEIDNQINIMLLHWAEKDKKDTIGLLPSLYFLIQKKLLHPSTLASLPLDSLKGKFSKITNFAYIVVGDSVLAPIFTTQEIQTLDSNRLNLGLHRFSDYQKIARFEVFNPEFMLYQLCYFKMKNSNLITHFKINGYKVLGDKKTILNIKD